MKAPTPMVDDTSRDANVIVIGTGPAGLTCAARLACLGFTVVLVGPRPAVPDSDRLHAGIRTAALFSASMDVLAACAPTDALSPNTARLGAIRIVDGFGGLLRAPTVTFKAEDIDVERLATNVPLSLLTDWLRTVVDTMPTIRWVEATATRVTPSADAVTVELAGDGTAPGRTLRATLVVAADGRDSLARAAAGIDGDNWAYDQTAIVAAFEHSGPHRDVSTEIHRPGGPCTTVPLPDGPGRQPRSSLVWLERAAIAGRLLALDDAAFTAALARHVDGHTGRIGRITPRASYPMRGATARTFGRSRIALIGETAHVFPPIGAQGLNLTMRDIAALATCLAEARAARADLGGDTTLTDYSRARANDVRARAFGVGAINSSLLTSIPGVGLARGAALHAINSVPALKRQIMRAGMTGVGPA